MRDHNSPNNSNDHQNFHPNNQHHNYLDDNYYDRNQSSISNYHNHYQDNRYYNQDFKYEQNYQQEYEQQKYYEEQSEQDNQSNNEKVKFEPDIKIKNIVKLSYLKFWILLFIFTSLIGYFVIFLISKYNNFLYDPNNIQKYSKSLHNWLYTMNKFKVWHLIAIIIILTLIWFIYIVLISTLFSNYKKYLKDMQQRTEEYQAQKLPMLYLNKPEEGMAPLLIKKMYERQIKKPYYANWFCLAVYIYTGVGAIIYSMFVMFKWGSGKLQDNEAIHRLTLKQYFAQPGQLTPYYILLGIFLGVILIHIITLLSVKYVRNALEEYWQTPILSDEKIKELEKKANRRSLIVFIILIIIAFFVLAFFFIFFKIERRKSSIFNVFKRSGK
ncbi:MSC_0882 family membrane protein [Mycoplasma leachii]|uniref:MSC_0882 family membrane protein n=1 Tax=Mycoplasma leachii TaxID=2105 RepID=UPI003DA4C27C